MSILGDVLPIGMGFNNNIRCIEIDFKMDSFLFKISLITT